MGSYYTPSEKILNQLKEVLSLVSNKFDTGIIKHNFAFDELSITIESECLVDVINFLKDNRKTLFRQLTDITAVDYPNRKLRFDVVYQLLSMSLNLRVRLKTPLAENASLPSLIETYQNADWLEREVFDMFGIYFTDHPDLRRLLTDFGFEGFPLRKDFPLSGFSEVFFDQDSQKVRYKKIELENEYRDFKSDNSWLDLDQLKKHIKKAS